MHLRRTEARLLPGDCTYPIASVSVHPYPRVESKTDYDHTWIGEKSLFPAEPAEKNHIINDKSEPVI
jgi:hypothetical protein